MGRLIAQIVALGSLSGLSFAALATGVPRAEGGPWASQADAAQGERAMRARWVRTWTSLAELEAARPGTPRYRELWDELSSFSSKQERDARKAHDREAAFRSRVLRGHLALIARTPVRFLADPLIEIDFLPGEAWLAARVLLPCKLRASATTEALRETDAPDFAARQAWAASVLRDDARALRIDGIEELARALDQGAPTAENGVLLADVLVLIGKEDAAEQVLARRLANTFDSAGRRELLYGRGRARLASGKRNEAEQWLGAAAAEGSIPARVTLGELALLDSASRRAAALFASLLEDAGDAEPVAHATALRGWGVALLSVAPRKGAVESGSNTSLRSDPSSPTK